MGNARFADFSAVIPALIAVATTFASPLTDNRLPPKPVNAFLLGDASYLYRQSIEQADVELLAYIKESTLNTAYYAAFRCFCFEWFSLLHFRGRLHFSCTFRAIEVGK